MKSILGLLIVGVAACSGAPDGAVPYGYAPPQAPPAQTLPVVSSSAAIGPCGNWAVLKNPDGTNTYGMYNLPISRRGYIDPNNCQWAQCGTAGAGC